jgi:hypothetical protein
MHGFNRISRFASEPLTHAPSHREHFRISLVQPFLGERARADNPGPAVWTHVRAHHYRPALTEEDVRLHAWLNERLAALHHERHGFWPRVHRLLRAAAHFVSRRLQANQQFGKIVVTV